MIESIKKFEKIIKKSSLLICSRYISIFIFFTQARSRDPSLQIKAGSKLLFCILRHGLQLLITAEAFGRYFFYCTIFV